MLNFFSIFVQIIFLYCKWEKTADGVKFDAIITFSIQYGYFILFFDKEIKLSYNTILKNSKLSYIFEND